jgi:hypothetical protein
MSLAVDATGFSVRSSKLVWLSSGASFRARRFVKAHLAVETTWLSVQSYVLTDGHIHDATQFEVLLDGVRGIGDVYADPGYLSLGNVWLVSAKGGTPYIKPKATTTGTSKWGGRRFDPRPYRRMVEAYRRAPDEWMARYHQRSKIEGLNGAIKRRLGRVLWSASDRFRRLELALKIVVWNLIRLVYKKTAQGEYF